MTIRRQCLAATFLAALLAGCGRPAAVATEEKPLVATEAPASEPLLPPSDLALPVGATLRLGSTQFRTVGTTDGGAISSDGKLVAYRNGPTTIRVVEALSGKEVRVVTVKEERIGSQFRFTNDGKCFLFSSYATVTLVDAQSGGVLGSFTGKGNIAWNTVFSADGSLAAASTGGNEPITFWDVKTGKARGTVTPAQRGDHYHALSSDGKMLATAGIHRSQKEGDEPFGQIVQLWDTATRQETKRIKAGSAVGGIHLSADGSLLVTEHAETGLVAVWEVATGKKVAEMKRQVYPGEFTHLHFSPDGRYLAYVLDNGRLDVWSVAAAKQLGSNTTTCQKVLGVAFPGNGTAIACGRNAQTIQVWKTPGDPVAAPGGHVGIVTAIRFTPDGKELLTAGTDYRVVRWDAATGKELGLVYSRRMHPIPGFERLAAEEGFFSLDAKWFAAPIDGGILVVDVEGKKEKATLRCKGMAPTRWSRLVLSADGSRLFGIASNFDQGKAGVTACAWDVKEGKMLDEQRLPVKDRSEELTVAEKCFKVKFADKYPGLPRENEATLGRPQFDPWTSSGYIGTRVTLKTVDSAKTLFDADTGCLCKNAVALSPDGKRLAVGWNDTTVIVFDLAAAKK